jgi:hypothetical protein
MLIDKIKTDLVAAMKSKDEVKKLTLRSLLSSLNYYKIELQRSLLDDDILSVLNREAKKHRESIEMYEKGNRMDLASKESAELAILQSYMPKQMEIQEVEKIINAEVKKLRSTGADLNPGAVMKAVMPILKEKVDGKVVKEIVDRLLQ